MNIELMDGADARKVDRFVLSHPDGTPFHETRWMQLVRTTFGFETQSLVAKQDGVVVGVLPLAMVTAPITGRRLVSVPFGVYGGILTSDTDAVAGLDEAACTLARRASARYVEMRYIGTAPTQHESLSLYETYRRELPEDAADVLNLIPRKRRAEVRKARDRHGATMTAGRAGLDEFYALYVSNKRRLGSPLFSKRYFTCLLDLYGPRASLHVVRIEERAVAAVLSLRARDVIYPYYSGSVPDADRLGANNYMYAMLMEEACRGGVRIFDFGRSRADSGAAAFKRHMGFSPTPLDYQFYFPRGGHPPALTPSNPKTAVPRRILSAVPEWVARLVGPVIMRHVP